MLEFLDYEEVSFRPDANIVHLCNNLNNIVGKSIWHDTFQVQNTKWLWLVNNVVAALNIDNMHCECSGQYASYVTGILNSVKKSISMFFVIKECYIAQTTLKHVFLIHRVPYHLSHIHITISC